jgi:catechol 2,3-dioxygenase-like lactoylglutathione lyase family enzyme
MKIKRIEPVAIAVKSIQAMRDIFENKLGLEMEYEEHLPPALPSPPPQNGSLAHADRPNSLVPWPHLHHCDEGTESALGIPPRRS